MELNSDAFPFAAVEDVVAMRSGRVEIWIIGRREILRKGVLSSGIRRDKSVAVVASTRDEITRSPTLTSTRRIASHCSSSAIERETGDSACGSPRKSSTEGDIFFIAHGSRDQFRISKETGNLSPEGNITTVT